MPQALVYYCTVSIRNGVFMKSESLGWASFLCVVSLYNLYQPTVEKSDSQSPGKVNISRLKQIYINKTVLVA